MINPLDGYKISDNYSPFVEHFPRSPSFKQKKDYVDKKFTRELFFIVDVNTAIHFSVNGQQSHQGLYQFRSESNANYMK